MVRLLTLNLWQEQGPWAQRLELLHTRLLSLQPDVICLQEVRQKLEAIPNQAETIANWLGMSFAYETAQDWGGGDEGLAILSRFSIDEKVVRELPFEEGQSRRICLGASVKFPEGNFWFFTTHLAYRLQDGQQRERQILAVDQFVNEHHVRGRTSVLAGDFNAIPDADEVRFLRGLTTLEGRRTFYQDAFAVCNPAAPGYTWSKENPYTAALEWLGLDRRLDYIFVTPMTRAGLGRIHSCRIVCSEPDERGIWCSDHFGLLAEIQLSPDPVVAS